jgi:hypothetical protein
VLRKYTVDRVRFKSSKDNVKSRIWDSLLCTFVEKDAYDSEHDAACYTRGGQSKVKAAAPVFSEGQPPFTKLYWTSWTAPIQN